MDFDILSLSLSFFPSSLWLSQSFPGNPNRRWLTGCVCAAAGAVWEKQWSIQINIHNHNCFATETSWFQFQHSHLNHRCRQPGLDVCYCVSTCRGERGDKQTERSPCCRRQPASWADRCKGDSSVTGGNLELCWQKQESISDYVDTTQRDVIIPCGGRRGATQCAFTKTQSAHTIGQF